MQCYLVKKTLPHAAAFSAILSICRGLRMDLIARIYLIIWYLVLTLTASTHTTSIQRPYNVVLTSCVGWIKFTVMYDNIVKTSEFLVFFVWQNKSNSGWVIFVESALKMQCYVVKKTLLPFDKRHQYRKTLFFVVHGFYLPIFGYNEVLYDNPRTLKVFIVKSVKRVWRMINRDKNCLLYSNENKRLLYQDNGWTRIFVTYVCRETVLQTYSQLTQDVRKTLHGR